MLFVGGSGVHLRDEQGDEYLDLLSGIGVMALGYAHPAVEAAIAAQSKRLLHTSNLFYHEHTAELALRLKYAGVPAERITVTAELATALREALEHCNGELYALPTYTAMLSLRELLRRSGQAQSSWARE